MTTLALQASQNAAGGPISARVVFTVTSRADDGAFGTVVLGVTTTSTPPALLSDFAHTDAGAVFPLSSTFWDSVAEQQSNGASRGVANSAFSDVLQMQRLQSIDTNYVVGRFVWAAAFASSPPSAGDAPLFLSSSYLIR